MTLLPPGRRRINRSRPRQADECACPDCLSEAPHVPPRFIAEPFPVEPMTEEAGNNVERLLDALERREARRRRDMGHA